MTQRFTPTSNSITTESIRTHVANMQGSALTKRSQTRREAPSYCITAPSRTKPALFKFRLRIARNTRTILQASTKT